MQQFDEEHHALVSEAIEEAEKCRDLLISVRSICARKGEDTNWEALDEKIAALGIGSITPRTFRLV